MRTKGLSAIVAVVTVAGCGGGASSKPPTEADLLVGLIKPPPLMVPGLQTPIAPAASREAPSPRECGAAWNQWAPRRTLRWVAARSARHADVTLMEAHGQQIGGTGKQFVLYNCMVGITVAPTEIVLAAAPPRGSGGVWAGELLTYRSRDTVTQLTKRFNATVGSDGKIHLG
jgi:hypothetical protein